MKLVADLRLSAVVAAAIACVIIAVAHVWYDATYWLINGLQGGWTIYPPLSALPLESANLSPDPFGYLVYMGVLTGALVAGGLSVGSLLVSAVMRRRQQREVAQSMLPLWLPLVLQLPLAIHLAGWSYHAYKATQREALLPYEQAFPEAADTQMFVPGTVDSLTEAEDDAMD